MSASTARAGEGVAVAATVTYEMLAAGHLGVIVPELNEVAEVGAEVGAEAAL